MMREKRSEFRISGKGKVLVSPLRHPPKEGECPKSTFMSEDLRDFSTAYEKICERFSESLALKGQMTGGVGDLLKLLDEKIDLVSQQVTMTKIAKDEPIQSIDIGAGGARFISNTQRIEGAYLALCLALLPGPYNVYVFAQCIRCEPVDDTGGEFEIAASFIDLPAKESQIIRRYVMQSERQKLRLSSAK